MELMTFKLVEGGFIPDPHAAPSHNCERPKPVAKSNEKIHDLVASNLDGLRRLCSLFESQDQPSQSLVQSYLARFKLWAGSLGAHRTSGSRSLEYRLRDASSIRKHLLSLLKELKDIVVKEGKYITLELERKLR